MRIEFDESFSLDLEVVFGFFRSPREWPRLYSSFGEVRDLGDDWIGVPLAAGAELEARITSIDNNRHVAWDLRGFAAGRGEVTVTVSDAETRVTGFEEVEIPSLAGHPAATAAEEEFAAIWQSGWNRLRQLESTDHPPATR